MELDLKFVAALTLFCMFMIVYVFPTAIDREADRLRAVAEYNCKHYGACERIKQ